MDISVFILKHVVHISSTILRALSCLRLASLAPLFCSQVKNVYQSSFSAFLDSLDVSRGADFPQVDCDFHGTCSAVKLPTYCFHLLSLPSACCCWACGCLDAVDRSSCFILECALSQCASGYLIAVVGGDKEGDIMLLFADISMLLETMQNVFVLLRHYLGNGQVVWSICVSALLT